MKLIVARHVDAMRKASARILAGMSPLPGQDPIKEFALCIGITAYQPGDTLETLKDRSDLGVKQAKKDPDKGTGYLIRMENGAPTPIPLKLQLAA